MHTLVLHKQKKRARLFFGSLQKWKNYFGGIFIYLCI